MLKIRQFCLKIFQLIITLWTFSVVLPSVSSANTQEDQTDKYSEAKELYNKASIYLNKSQHDLALPLLEKIYRLQSEVFGEKDLDTLKSGFLLGSTYTTLGRYNDARLILEKVLELHTEVLGEDNFSTISTMGNLAVIYSKMGRNADAVLLDEKVVKMFRSLLGEKAPRTLTSMNNLAGDYRHLARYVDALPLDEKVLKFRIEVLGEKHPDTLLSMSNVGQDYFYLGHLAEALPFSEKALKFSTEILGEKHSDTIIRMDGLAVIYRDLGRINEALILNEKSLKLLIETLGENNDTTLASMNNLSLVYEDLGRYNDALQMLDRVAKIRTDLYGEKHPDTMNALNNIAVLYNELGRFSEALEIDQKTLTLRIEVLGEKHPDTLLSMSNLCEDYRVLGRYTEAISLCQKTLQMEFEVLGEKHPKTLSTMQILVMTYIDFTKYSEAGPLAAKVMALRIEVLGEKNIETILSIRNLGVVYIFLNRPLEALPLFERALTLSMNALGPKNPTTLDMMDMLAILGDKGGRYLEASQLREKILKERTDLLGEKHPGTLETMSALARDYKSLDRIEEAGQVYEKVIAGIEALRVNGGLSIENRQSLFAQWVFIYKQYSDLLLDLSEAGRAFHMAELSKARTLLESTTIRRANQSGILPKEDQNRVESYEKSISLLNNEISKNSDETNKKITLENEKDQLNKEYSTLRQQLMIKFPKYAQSSEVKIVEAMEGKTLLDNDSVLISYLFDSGNLIIFSLSSADGLTALRLPPIPNLDRTIKTYRRLIQEQGEIRYFEKKGNHVWKLLDGSYTLSPTQPENGAKQITNLSEIGAYLGEKLLSPVKTTTARKKQWIISPDETLALIPFETLILDNAPIISDHDINYTQSLSMLALLKKRDTEYKSIKGRISLFAMGGAIYEDPSQGNNGIRRTSTNLKTEESTEDRSKVLRNNARQLDNVQRAFDLLGNEWTNLPGSIKEIGEVSDLFESKETRIYKEQDATEAKLQDLNSKGELSKFRFLLFSAHGYLSTEEPLLSSLVLGQVNKTPGTDYSGPQILDRAIRCMLPCQKQKGGLAE